ncbi:hypothetical protein [Lysinibacillus sp. 54212]|uniref:hypothetical protein n=1 Tax=Lysinibacillus sp. 54212 TaxID=3119829 RepID=UPI002FC60429
MAKLSRSHFLVIRFPKKQAYGKTIPFDRQELLSEYGGNGFYYRQANMIMSGICPDEYDFYVDSELTYTIESYMGQSINLSVTDSFKARDYGMQLGEFFRKMENVKLNLEGFGSLIWKDGKLEGFYKEDPLKLMADEKDKFHSEWSRLREAKLSFDRSSIEGKLSWCLEKRSVSSISLTNQDTSPENLIIRDGRVHLIDPRPVIYSGVAAAGNHVNNYKTLFPTYDQAPRYIKNQFHMHKDVLYALATGFEEGYTNGLVEQKKALKIEQFLELFSLCYGNYDALQKESNTETYLRMGDKQAIESRIPIYLRELETFEFK